MTMLVLARSPGGFHPMLGPGSIVAGESVACPVRCVVADADATDRRMLADLLRDANAVVVGESVHARDGGSMVQALQPDVVLLDARMPSQHVAAIAEAAMESRCQIIVVSALASDAVLGFRLNAVDFLLKPYARSWVQLAVARVRARVRELDGAGDAATGTDGAPRLAIAVDRGVEYLPLAAIEWIAAVGYGACVHTGDRAIATRTPFTAMLRWADDWSFLRSHRGTIVNAASVRRLDAMAGGTGMLTLHSGRTLPVAKRRLAAIRRALGRESATPSPFRVRRPPRSADRAPALRWR